MSSGITVVRGDLCHVCTTYHLQLAPEQATRCRIRARAASALLYKGSGLSCVLAHPKDDEQRDPNCDMLTSCMDGRSLPGCTVRRLFLRRPYSIESSVIKVSVVCPPQPASCRPEKR